MKSLDFLHIVPLMTWGDSFNQQSQLQTLSFLESGKLIYLPQLSFKLNADEKKFLSPTYANPKNKNISLDHKTDQITGVNASSNEQMQLKMMMQRFSGQAKQLIDILFPHYISNLEQGRTSFRPVEVRKRNSSYRKDDTRLHVDAFPSSPNQGKRILRVFSNINLYGQDRVWRVGESFENVARRFLPQLRKPFPGSSLLLRLLNITKSKRTAYDHIMLKMHNAMKADSNYQKTVEQAEIRFPSATSWIVMTDHVSHAALEGQHVLEQTFYLPVHAMYDEQQAPLRILERLVGTKLV